MGNIGLGIWTRKIEGGALFAVYPESTEDGGWPSCIYNVTDEEVDVVQRLICHPADGEIAVLVECGAEKLRYISVHAQAFDNTGKIVSVSLDGIYKLAFNEFGKEPTDATY